MMHTAQENLIALLEDVLYHVNLKTTVLKEHYVKEEHVASRNANLIASVLATLE